MVQRPTDDQPRPLTDLVDPFCGNGACDLPPAKGLAATWFWPKAQAGNTHPGACLPFSLVSALPYSGAYITGYGVLAPNAHGTPKRLYDLHGARGISHIQHSGTGAIGRYYNYFLLTPLAAERSWASRLDLVELYEESATPGAYRCRLGTEAAVDCALTVASHTACHRYRFPSATGNRLVLDLGIGGLQIPGMASPAEAVVVERHGADAVSGCCVFEGIPLFFHAVASSGTCRLWQDETIVDGDRLAQTVRDPDAAPNIGVVWQDIGEEVAWTIAISRANEAAAQVLATVAQRRGFDSVRLEARRQWQSTLDGLRVAGGRETDRRILASAWYHSCLKPVRTDAGADGDLFVDCATLWDQYKTQLPLIFATQPQQGAAIVASLMDSAERRGGLPNALLLAQSEQTFANQAACLFHMVCYSAWCHRLPGFDTERALRLMLADFRRGPGRFIEQPDRFPSPTHVLDCSQAAWCIARLAAGLGHPATAERYHRLAIDSWTQVVDEQGLMLDGRYYEGSRWTYSFRPLHDWRRRIARGGGETAVLAQLDAFFGFDAAAVARPGLAPDWDTVMRPGLELHRFEGLTNEPDMESPFFYHGIGRPARTATIVRAVCRQQFGLGPGGLCGNDDSGGLSSWFVWAAVGLMPLAGLDLLCLTAPLFDEVVLPWGGKELHIRAPGAAERPYIAAAQVNGRDWPRAWFQHHELADGATIDLELSPEPTAWGQDQLPDPLHTGPERPL